MTSPSVHILTDASGSWQVTLHRPDHRPEGHPHGSEAICMVDAERTVLVRNDAGRLNTPGGHPEPGETSEQTMIREVREEVCAIVDSSTLIAYARSEKLDGENAGYVMVRDMYVARVTLLPWQQPEHEIVERVIVQIADLATIMSADWPGLDAFSLELVAMATSAFGDIGLVRRES